VIIFYILYSIQNDKKFEHKLSILIPCQNNWKMLCYTYPEMLSI